MTITDIIGWTTVTNVDTMLAEIYGGSFSITADIVRATD